MLSQFPLLPQGNSGEKPRAHHWNHQEHAEQSAGSQGLAGAPEGKRLAQLHISHAWHATGI